MTVYEGIIQIGKQFPSNTFIVYECNGKTGRIIDFCCTLKEAEEYRKLGKKQGIRVEIAEYDVEEKAVYYH